MEGNSLRLTASSEDKNTSGTAVVTLPIQGEKDRTGRNRFGNRSRTKALLLSRYNKLRQEKTTTTSSSYPMQHCSRYLLSIYLSTYSNTVTAPSPFSTHSKQIQLSGKLDVNLWPLQHDIRARSAQNHKTTAIMREREREREREEAESAPWKPFCSPMASNLLLQGLSSYYLHLKCSTW
jgi:hypothetical protein